MENVATKTREQRAEELKALMAQEKAKPESKPYVTTDGKVDNQGIMILRLDTLALVDGYRKSSTGKSNINFTTIDLGYLGRININAVKK
jgi:hypothetical protein